MTLVIVAAGCARSTATTRRNQPQLSMRLIEHHVEKPSKVTLFFSVHDEKGAPLPSSQLQQVEVFEDGELISAFESKHVLLSPIPAMYYTLVLVDRSSSVTKERHLQQIKTAVNTITARANHKHRVAVYAFDGSKTLMELSKFSASPPNVGERVGTVKPEDPSTNLHGAMAASLQLLGEQTNQKDDTLRFGTLVVLSDGSDRAKRVDLPAVEGALKSSGFNAVSIGVGSEINPADLKRIAHADMALIDPNPEELENQLNQIFQRIEQTAGAYYRLAYCSPARLGHRQLRVKFTSKEGAEGTLERGFKADGFEPGCEPKSSPYPPVPVPSEVKEQAESSG